MNKKASRKSYTREFLLQLRCSDHAQNIPFDLKKILEEDAWSDFIVEVVKIMMNLMMNMMNNLMIKTVLHLMS